MLLPDLDRYYTPASVARRVVEVSDFRGAGRCLDAACGDGSLLVAAREVHAEVQCIGMDVDSAAIARLRRRHPAWILSRADALCLSSWKRAVAARQGVGCDLVLLNPPFSMAAKKGISITAAGFSGRCSVAMAHLVTVLTQAMPRSCCVIVPESLLFSDLDARARAYLATFYEVRPVQFLRNSTFRGGRANAAVVGLERLLVPRAHERERGGEPDLTEPRLVRGGLPLFEAAFRDGGVPYVHSTDLGTLAWGGRVQSLRRVRPLSRGVVSGNVILLPRVGVPLRDHVVVLNLMAETQLSDCVMALCFRSRTTAVRWERALSCRWKELVGVYRGTGARYVTVNRLRGWLATLDVQ